MLYALTSERKMISFAIIALARVMSDLSTGWRDGQRASLPAASGDHPSADIASLRGPGRARERSHWSFLRWRAASLATVLAVSIIIVVALAYRLVTSQLCKAHWQRQLPDVDCAELSPLQ